MFIRTILLTLCIANVAYARQAPERQRFKHEKHGAIVFASGDGYELKCDIYQPVSDEPRPIMLAIHGGAWTTGSKFAMLRHARILANRGYVVMSFNYRLAPQHKWPAQIHDYKHAVRWIREHAAKYNADPEHVYAFGYSAGGHLGAMLAATDKDDGLEGESIEPYSKHSSRIDGLIAGGAPTEFSWLDEQSTSLVHWLGDTKANDPDIYANASATTFLTEDDPPMVLFHGTADALVPTSSAEEFVSRCKEAKVNAELQLCNGGHIVTFSLTTNFINSLETLEAMLSKQQCQKDIESVRALAVAFRESKGRSPKSIDEFAQYAVASGKIKANELKGFATSVRDGKRFQIDWTSESGIIVSETDGVDGEKLSSKR